MENKYLLATYILIWIFLLVVSSEFISTPTYIKLPNNSNFISSTNRLCCSIFLHDNIIILVWTHLHAFFYKIMCHHLKNLQLISQILKYFLEVLFLFSFKVQLVTYINYKYNKIFNRNYLPFFLYAFALYGQHQIVEVKSEEENAWSIFSPTKN